jgi:hypothetical protein
MEEGNFLKAWGGIYQLVAWWSENPAKLAGQKDKVLKKEMLIIYLAIWPVGSSVLKKIYLFIWEKQPVQVCYCHTCSHDRMKYCEGALPKYADIQMQFPLPDILILILKLQI